MALSNETKEFIENGTIGELEQMMYDIRDAVNTREDVDEVIEMMEANDLPTWTFCKRKRPQPTQ